MHVRADVHERPSRTYRLLATDPDIQLETEPLIEGDYLIANRVLIERKTLDDFSQSVRSGRLFKQAYRLKARRDILPLVVVENFLQPAHRSDLITRQGLGAQLTLALSYGVPIIIVYGPEQLVWLIKRIGHHLQRRHAKTYIPNVGRTTNPLEQAQKLLGQLPGVGPTKAKALIQHFGSLKAVFNASAKELTDVKGIGKPLAEALTDLFQGSQGPKKKRNSPI